MRSIADCVIADCRLKDAAGQGFQSAIKNHQSTIARAREEVRDRRPRRIVLTSSRR
jgi:hypothetical protein